MLAKGAQLDADVIVAGGGVIGTAIAWRAARSGLAVIMIDPDSIGLRAERLDARQTRQPEPFLAPSTRGGVLAPGDLSVDNRRYLAALRHAAANADVQAVTGMVIRAGTGRVQATVPGPDGPAIVALHARHVVIAAGHATWSIEGVPAVVRQAIRPVKGQILRLRHPGTCRLSLPAPSAPSPRVTSSTSSRGRTASWSSVPPRRNATTAMSPPAPCTTCCAPPATPSRRSVS
jgi:glycine/D-amino acid oxidase-like deaminating enzyme